MQQQFFIQTNSSDNKSRPFSWREFFSFRMMITLQVIEIIYFIIAGIITLGGIITMFPSNNLPAFMHGGILTGLAVLVFGNILWRICCEIIIVFFRINETLSEIGDHTKEEHL